MQAPAIPPIHVTVLAPEHPWYAQPEVWLTIFTLLLVIATFLLVLQTRNVWQRSDIAIGELTKQAQNAAASSRESADAAKRSAEAAVMNAEAARDAAQSAKMQIEFFIGKERARVRVDVLLPQLVPSPVPDGTVPHSGVKFKLVNYGPSSAFTESAQAQALLVDDIDAPVDFSSAAAILIDKPIVGNTETSVLWCSLTPTPILDTARIQRVHACESFLIFCGFVKYKDIFGQLRQTHFYLRWHVSVGGVLSGTVQDWWEKAGPPGANAET